MQFFLFSERVYLVQSGPQLELGNRGHMFTVGVFMQNHIHLTKEKFHAHVFPKRKSSARPCQSDFQLAIYMTELVAFSHQSNQPPFFIALPQLMYVGYIPPIHMLQLTTTKNHHFLLVLISIVRSKCLLDSELDRKSLTVLAC